jgi:hypothetical protein
MNSAFLCKSAEKNAEFYVKNIDYQSYFLLSLVPRMTGGQNQDGSGKQTFAKKYHYSKEA